MSDESALSTADGGAPGTRQDAERAIRRVLAENDLPEPDEIRDHEDGGIVCLWHGPKVAVVVDLEPAG